MFECSLGLIFFIICIPYLGQTQETKCNMTAKMIEAGIIPKILPHGPEQSLQVFLPNSTDSLEPGTMHLHDTSFSIPKFVFEAPADTWNSLFIVVKVNWDPEEKIASRSYNTTPAPRANEWRELAIFNIPGNEYAKGKTILDYDPPYHDLELEVVDLFLYLVYRQPRKFVIHRRTSMITANNTVLSTLDDYIRHYNLTGPVAGNFMYRRWPQSTGTKGPRKQFALEDGTLLSYENLETKEEDNE